LAVKLPELSVTDQAIAMAVLGESNDVAVTAQLAEMLGSSDDESFRSGVVQVLGSLGGTDAVDPVLHMANRAEGDAQKEARRALRRMPGEAVDVALLGRAGSGDVLARGEAIEALGDRGYTNAASALLGYAEKDAKHVRRASLKALGSIASAGDLERLAKMAGKDESAGDALALASRRLGNAGDAAGAVVAAMKDLDSGAQASILPALSAMGGKEALGTVKGLLGNKELRNPAIRALSKWSDSEAVPVLLELASADNISNEEQVLVLRGLAGMLENEDSGISDEDRLKHALAAMKAAKRPEEKQLLLPVLGSIGNEAAIESLKGMLDDKDVAEEASQALIGGVREMAKRDPKGAQKLLKQIIRTSKDERTVRQARRALNRL